MYKLILLILFPLVTNASDLDNYIIPWGYVELQQYRGSTTPAYLNLSGENMLVGGIDMEINFPIYYKYLYFGMGTFAQGDQRQFTQQLGKFWIGSYITKNVSLVLKHHSSHNFDNSMPDDRVPFTTLDQIQLRFNFGAEPKR
jgi:hypothetical protein